MALPQFIRNIEINTSSFDVHSHVPKITVLFQARFKELEALLLIKGSFTIASLERRWDLNTYTVKEIVLLFRRLVKEKGGYNIIRRKHGQKFEVGKNGSTLFQWNAQKLKSYLEEGETFTIVRDKHKFVIEKS